MKALDSIWEIPDEGTFYVTDQIPRITMLDADGNLISRARTPYNGHGMWIDSKGNIYLAANEAGVTKLAKRHSRALNEY